jgi:hypothetical protein
MTSFLKIKPTKLAHGSYVVIKYRSGKPPTRALKVISNDKSKYFLYDLVQNKTKSYIFDIARRDCLEICVEKVHDMTGDPKKVTTIQFLIKWLGYNDTHNTWEPWKEVRDDEILHTHLRAKNLTNS